jgi:hypothetical protein
MAELILKQGDRTTFACYSERGVMSYFMFRVLSHRERLWDFLRRLVFPQGAPNPFANVQAVEFKEITLFSELHFGTSGYGLPDAALFFVIDQTAYFIFIEAKANETYVKTCMGKSKEYSDTGRGQIEMKYRAVWCFFNGVVRTNMKGIRVLHEERTLFGPVYPDDPNTFRDLEIKEGVKDVFEKYIGRCSMRTVFFVFASEETTSPFTDANKDYLPRCYDGNWDATKWRFAWIDFKYIEQSPNM